MRACVRVCVRACVRACVYVCMYICMHARVHACTRACVFQVFLAEPATLLEPANQKRSVICTGNDVLLVGQRRQIALHGDAAISSVDRVPLNNVWVCWPPQERGGSQHIHLCQSQSNTARQALISVPADSVGNGMINGLVQLQQNVLVYSWHP